MQQFLREHIKQTNNKLNDIISSVLLSLLGILLLKKHLDKKKLLKKIVLKNEMFEKMRILLIVFLIKCFGRKVLNMMNRL